MTDIQGAHNHHNTIIQEGPTMPMPGTGGMDFNGMMGMMGNINNPQQMIIMMMMMMLQMLQQMLSGEEEQPSGGEHPGGSPEGPGGPGGSESPEGPEGSGDDHHCCPCHHGDDEESSWEVDNENKTIKLDNGYELEFSNERQEWTLTDEEGNVVRVWGDPHVDENGDGSTDWDFKQDSTFVLDDGTKITVGTKDIGRDDGMTVSDTLTITRGDQAIEVTGIADNNVQISEVMNNGQELDAATNDGFVFFEGDDGVNSWYTEGGELIDENQAMGRARTYEYDEEADYEV